ncbi:IS3 family transposase [Alkalicella caledoniensis]|uniref:IS3 family transposase n=1 Tax=Alkalicella caledoniensis TaxID=2731377 RepID=UPI003CCCC05B
MAKDRNNKQYSKEFKESILKRIADNESVPKLSEELGISKSTLYQWARNEKKTQGDVPDNKPSTKWSSEDKFHVVLETASLSEVELAAYCRRKGIYVDDVKSWKQQCLKANTTVSKNPQKIDEELKAEKKKAKDLEKDLKRKEKALAEAAALLVLRKKAQANLGGPRGRMISSSDRKVAVELIDDARASGARLKPACEELNISERTYQRWTAGISDDIKEDQRPLATRPTPKNKLSEEERDEVVAVVNKPEFADLVPSQIVPKLADQGKYIASESTIYRVLKEEKMNTHRNRSKPPIRRPIPTHIAIAPNQVWTWDITWLPGPVKGQYFKLYLIVDIYSRKIVAHEVWETENAQYAEYLVKKAVLAEGIAGKPLVLHSDNGSPMKAATFLATLEKLGVQSSFSRPRVCNDNPFSESLFKTLKYRHKYPTKGFSELSESRKWVLKFVNWYNYDHLHSGINFVTPNQRHNGLDKAIMEKRIATYEAAKRKHPERWSGSIRDWSVQKQVTLNPVREKEFEEQVR